jgi:SAM-dependent methyltransferase
MLRETEVGQMKYNPERTWWINTPEGRKDNNGYSAPFPLWWKIHGLKGLGYLIGEQHPQGWWIINKLCREYPEVISAFSVDVQQADMIFDISIDSLPDKVDFVFCMAVLEHVYDPLTAVRNMSASLKPGGLLCISVPGQGFKQHRRPIDCYRFLEDAITAFAVVGDVHLLDYTACGKEWCAIYRKL